MTLYSLCTRATCDVCVMKGLLVEIRISHTVKDIEKFYKFDFLRREIARVDTYNGHIQVWLKEE